MIKTGQVKVSVITLGGIYQLDQVKLPDNSVCFCFKDFQETKENVYKNIYFVNPIDTYSIECSGLVLRKQILKVYQTVINKRVDYKHSLRDYTSAIVNLEKALRYAFNDETRKMVYYNLAVANYYDENYKLALIHAKKAEEYGDSLELHVLKGEIYLKEKNTKNAIIEYKFLIKNYPDNFDYIINLANIYVKEKRYIDAREVLKDYLKKHPENKNSSRLKPYKILLLF